MLIFSLIKSINKLNIVASKSFKKINFFNTWITYFKRQTAAVNHLFISGNFFKNIISVLLKFISNVIDISSTLSFDNTILPEFSFFSSFFWQQIFLVVDFFFCCFSCFLILSKIHSFLIR